MPVSANFGRQCYTMALYSRYRIGKFKQQMPKNQILFETDALYTHCELHARNAFCKLNVCAIISEYLTYNSNIRFYDRDEICLKYLLSLIFKILYHSL